MKDLYKTLFAALPEAVAVLAGGEQIYTNPSFKKLFGDIPVQNVVPYELLEAEDSIAGSVATSRGSAAVFVCRQDGETVVTVFPPADPADDRAALDSTCAAIRNTLGVFHMASSLIRAQTEPAGDPKMNLYSAMLNQSYYTVMRLTNNIAGIGPGENALFDIVELCRDLVESVAVFISGKRIELTFGSDVDSLVVSGRAELIERALLNLLSNSIKYTPAGGRVHVRVQRLGDRAVLSVSDTGCGISSSQLRSAFSRFREARSTTDPNAGVGFGLTVVREIAEAHGGGIFLESSPDKGTRVAISIALGTGGDDKVSAPTVKYKLKSSELILTELSDVLDNSCYMPEFLD